MLRGGAFGGMALLSLAGRGRIDDGAGRGTPPDGRRGAPGDGRGAAPEGQGALTAANGTAATPARQYDFDQGWLFGGVYLAGAEQPGYPDDGFTRVTLPHTVTAAVVGQLGPHDAGKTCGSTASTSRGPTSAAAGCSPTSTA